jgi:hypothetical protein
MVTLANGEDARHFKSSVELSGHRGSTVVAVVPHHRVYDRSAKVECLAVSSLQVALSKRQGRTVVLQTSAFGEPEGREWEVRLGKNVPKGAMWLLNTEGEDPRHAGGDGSASEYGERLAAIGGIKKGVATMWATFIALCATLGIAVGLWYLAAGDPFPVVGDVLLWCAIVWTALSGWLLGVWAAKVTVAVAKRWWWGLKREEGVEWTGGTRRGLLLRDAILSSSELSIEELGQLP